MTEPRPVVVVMAVAPRSGLLKPELEELLGTVRAQALQAALIRRAVGWASEVGTPVVAYAPDDAREELAALVPEGTRLVAQAPGDVGARLAAAAEAAFEGHDGPVLVVGVDTPQMPPAVGHAAIEDLREGVDVTFAPSSDGGYYLVGLREPHPEVFALPADVWGGPHAIERSLAAASEAGLSVGMLRAERPLDGEGDVRAFLADPLAPAEIVALLRP